jgi:hypothetical protein
MTDKENKKSTGNQEGKDKVLDAKNAKKLLPN